MAQAGLWGVIFAMVLAAAGLWYFQSYGVYRFDPRIHTPASEGLTGVREASFKSGDGTPIAAWVRDPAPGRPVIVSFYGNFAGIAPSVKRLLPLTDDGSGLVMMEYRGSGATPGPPGEEQFAADARALYDGLDTLLGQTVPPERRILHGFSLGSGVAIRLATERTFAAVILEATIPSLCRYFTRRYHGLPLCALMWRERFDVTGRIGQIGAPKLFVHGAEDQAVPADWGREVFALAPEPKSMTVIDGAGHNDLAAKGLFPAIRSFLQANGL